MTYKHKATFKIFPDGFVPGDLSEQKTIELKQLDDGSFGQPQAHNYIHHPDYFEAKADRAKFIPLPPAS